jgi:hypothetical protein
MSKTTAAAVSGRCAESRYNQLWSKKDEHPAVPPIPRPPPPQSTARVSAQVRARATKKILPPGVVEVGEVVVAKEDRVHLFPRWRA